MGQKVSFDTKISQSGSSQGAGRDQHNIMETNKTQSYLTKTIKIQYSFKIPVVTHTTIGEITEKWPTKRR